MRRGLLVMVAACGRIGFDPLNDGATPSTGCFAEVAAGNRATCVRRVDGTLSCSGQNLYGTLGVGMSVPDQNTPVEVTAIGMIITVRIGAAHVCTLTSSGVWCWGYNANGQIGVGSTTNQFLPVNLQLAAVLGVATGNDHTCAWDDSAVLCWGDNTYGQVGTTPDPLRPAITFGSVAAVTGGGNHTCAINNGDNAVWCWGRNDLGQLGDGTTMPRTIPVRTAIGTVIELDAGYGHTCARAEDGRVICWGDNTYGQVGDGTTGNFRVMPAAIDGLVAMSVKCGHRHCCASHRDGTVSCWGHNDDGQLGDGTTTMSPVPVATLPIPFAADVSVSDEASPDFTDHSCARTIDGVWCWGSNQYGQLGIGPAPSAPVPTRTMFGC